MRVQVGEAVVTGVDEHAAIVEIERRRDLEVAAGDTVTPIS